MFVFGLSSPWALLRLGGIAVDFLAAALGRFSLLCALAAFVFAAGASGIGGAGTIDGTSSESSSPSCAAGASGLEALAPADSGGSVPRRPVPATVLSLPLSRSGGCFNRSLSMSFSMFLSGRSACWVSCGGADISKRGRGCCEEAKNGKCWGVWNTGTVE